MTFSEYLVSKKINETTFQAHDTALFIKWQSDFVLMHPDSFTMRHKFLLNPIRRKYLVEKGEIV
jgi:hypothetical protein